VTPSGVAWPHMTHDDPFALLGQTLGPRYAREAFVADGGLRAEAEMDAP